MVSSLRWLLLSSYDGTWQDSEAELTLDGIYAAHVIPSYVKVMKKKKDRSASRHPRNLQNGKRQDMAVLAGNRNWDKPRGKNIIKVPNHLVVIHRSPRVAASTRRTTISYKTLQVHQPSTI